MTFSNNSQICTLNDIIFHYEISEISEQLVSQLKELNKDERNEFAELLRDINKVMENKFDEFENEEDIRGSYWSKKLYKLMFESGIQKIRKLTKNFNLKTGLIDDD